MTVQVKLLPTKEQIRLLKQRSQEYMKLITILVSEMVKEKYKGYQSHPSKYSEKECMSTRFKACTVLTDTYNRNVDL